MSKLKIGSPVRIRKKSLSSYASFALFVAAAAIALSAFIVRMGKENLVDTQDDTTGSTSRQTVFTSSAREQASKPAESSTTARTSQVNRKQTAATTQKVVQDEYDDFEDSEQTLAIQVMGNNRTYVRPSGGAVIKPFSMKELVYSRTMKDWRVHNGLDIAAEKGEVVKSAAEGKVTDISQDALYGTTVVVNQNDGLMVWYRGLNKETAVRQGENIAAGATIGTVGDIPCEAADGTHLHIEVMSENKYLDPADMLGIK